MRFIISEATSHAYNVYLDIVCHCQKDSSQWYVAGYGHEASHILAWDMCCNPKVCDPRRNDVTKEFAETVAELCNKLLDACDTDCSDVFAEYDGWEDYIHEWNPG